MILNVLDYSILVGIDEEKMELVVGIIDFMRLYDILKQMERVGKSTYHYSTSLYTKLDSQRLWINIFSLCQPNGQMDDNLVLYIMPLHCTD